MTHILAYQSAWDEKEMLKERTTKESGTHGQDMRLNGMETQGADPV
jgi:hypothetical protein